MSRKMVAKIEERQLILLSPIPSSHSKNRKRSSHEPPLPNHNGDDLSGIQADVLGAQAQEIPHR